MFQQESLAVVSAAICPDCGSQLHREDASLRCDAHGSFFIYGPNLLVRCAPDLQEQPIISLLPWQTLVESKDLPR